MDKYIKKEEAIRALLNDAPEQVGYSREDAADCIRYMDAADVSPAKEWVSIDDRLPEEGEYVLCSLKGFNYGGNIQVCKFVPADKFKDKPYFEHFRNGFPSVTHWMPLPEPPEENLP